MRKYATALLCALALVACQKAAPSLPKGAAPGGVQPTDVSHAKVSDLIQPVPQFMDHANLGSELGANGMVTKDNDKITAGEPVYLTMVFRESPTGLQASAVWTTIDKKPIATERKEMNGAKVATFTLKEKLKPGRYKVTGYWGGNIAAEREFEITGAEKGKKAKG